MNSLEQNLDFNQNIEHFVMQNFHLFRYLHPFEIDDYLGHETKNNGMKYQQHFSMCLMPT